MVAMFSVVFQRKLFRFFHVSYHARGGYQSQNAF